MTKAMQKLVKDHFDCKLVDEFLTSQICCDCKAGMTRCMNQDKDEASGFQKEIQGVRYYVNCAAGKNGKNSLKS
jgi:hypothetical protein